ncbi:MAG: dTMP kinase [Pseudomonadota bacterium]
MRRGMFVSFEGLEGVGKTTAIERFSSLLDQHGIDYVSTREPGGTNVAERLRGIVLDEHEEALTDTTELLLMFAARAQNVAQNIRPTLERGVWVICDRFTDATLAYQGYGRGISLDRINQLADWVHGDLWPDATVLLTADRALTERRLSGRGQARDRIEQERQEFFERAGNGYQALMQASPERFHEIDANQDLQGVAEQLERLTAALVDRWKAR